MTEMSRAISKPEQGRFNHLALIGEAQREVFGPYQSQASTPILPLAVLGVMVLVRTPMGN